MATWACACAYVHIAVLIQHATRMRHIVTPFVDSRSPLCFSTLSHKRCDFRTKVVEHKMCVLIFSTTFVYNMFDSKNNLARYRQNAEKFSCRVPNYFCRILMKFKFSGHFFENVSNIKFNQSAYSGSRVVPCGQTDVTKLIVAFRNFANAPKNEKSEWEMNEKEWKARCAGIVRTHGVDLLKASPHAV